MMDPACALEPTEEYHTDVMEDECTLDAETTESLVNVESPAEPMPVINYKLPSDVTELCTDGSLCLVVFLDDQNPFFEQELLAMGNTAKMFKDDNIKMFWIAWGDNDDCEYSLGFDFDGDNAKHLIVLSAAHPTRYNKAKATGILTEKMLSAFIVKMIDCAKDCDNEAGYEQPDGGIRLVKSSSSKS